MLWFGGGSLGAYTSVSRISVQDYRNYIHPDHAHTTSQRYVLRMGWVRISVRIGGKWQGFQQPVGNGKGLESNEQ